MRTSKQIGERARLVVVLLVTGLLGACQSDDAVREFKAAAGKPHDLSIGMHDSEQLHEPIRPLPTKMQLDEAKVALGEQLYHDKRLSGDNTLSCASCHNIAAGGSDNRDTSVGIDGQIGPINSPTVLNSTFSFVQFWDGRADSLQSQAAGPVTNPMEMGANWEDVIRKLKADEQYVSDFNSNYLEGITADTVTNAIAEFERSLVTPSAFDRYLRGDYNAISAQAREGYELFKSNGCVSCHQGINVGGNMFQKFGALIAFSEEKALQAVDDGRMAVTNDPNDKLVFKVPSLRNAARTAPYFHNAAAKTLEDAIRIMASIQLGKTLAEDEVASIKSFIVSLNGEVGGRP